jgi:hypothetical protein
MSLVTLTTQTGATYSAELQAKREFRLPATGNAGQGSVLVPYSSPLAAHVSPNGLDLLLIQHPTAGDWMGIVTTVEYGDEGITLTALQPWGLIGRRVVQRADTVNNVWPGYLAGIAMDAATVAGMVQVYPAPNGDTPLVPSYSFGYGDAWSVLQALMDMSDGELSVDAGTGQMDWCGSLSYANAYSPLLIAGQNLRDWKRASEAGDQVSEVLGTFGTGVYSAVYADTAAHHWPAQAMVNANTEREARELAEQVLSSAAFPAIAVSGSVTYAHAAIRERDYVQVLVPHVGETYTCRVLARSVDDTANVIGMEFQVMPDEALVRVPAPGHGSKRGGRGSGPLGVRVLRMSRGT